MSARRWVVPALALAAAAGLAASFAAAYTFTCGMHTNGFGTFRVNPNFRDGHAGSDAQQIGAFTRAASEWSTRGGARFRWTYAGETGNAEVDLTDMVNACFSVNDSSGSILAYVICAMAGSRLDFDMVFYDGWTWNDNAADGSGGFDIQGIATHELGHALGLGHSNVANTTMWPSSLGNGVANRSIEADDIAGIRHLYGVSVPPTVTSIAPASGPLSGGNHVTILGSGFAASTSVFFDGSEAEVRYVVPPGEISVVMPAGAATGEVDVEVRDVFGGSFVATDGYSYESNTPRIELVSGSPSPGATLTIQVTGPVGARWAAATGDDGTPSRRRGIDFCFDVRGATLIGNSLAGGSDPRLDSQGRALMTAVVPSDAEIFSFVYFQGVVQVGPDLVPTDCLVLSVFP